MRTHIMLVLTALLVSACASKRDVASNNSFEGPAQETSQQASFLDGQASRIR